VNLIVVHGGGHTIPQDRFAFPRLYGRTSTEVNAPQEIWSFFERQLEKQRRVSSAME
jgi:poly(3-hydroxybutyrate) depolymerase